ncbi:MAG TPA: hypothetical protein VIU61_01970 [Kofleriaceae bacterium]
MASRNLATKQLPTDDDPLAYWWKVCRGTEVMRAFHAAPETEAWNVVYQYPVLLLPELVDAAEREMGPTRETRGLREMQRALHGTAHFPAFMRMLAMALGGEPGGARRTNLERALAVMHEVRAAGMTEALDDEIEAALHLQLASLSGSAGSAPVTSDPTWQHLFLDEVELRGFKRDRDRRNVHPNPSDRMFKTAGGLCAGSCEWVGDEASAVAHLVETRWLFPSTKAARIFFESLKSSGAESDGLASVAIAQVADGAYAWGGILAPTRRQIVCVRIARVVAKIEVTQGIKAAALFQVLTPAMMKPFVDLVVPRVRWALAQYWLAVMRGTEAANRFVEMAPRVAERDHAKLFAEFPILIHPEFPTAMASLGERHRLAAERVVALRQVMKSNNWSGYRDTMRALVRQLLDEPGGESRVHGDSALELVVEHRRADTDFTWSAIETECRERA